MSLYLLDTNICIYLIKNKPAAIRNRFLAHVPSEIAISSISVAELAYGVAKNQQKEQNGWALEQFLAPLVVAEFDGFAAQMYGRIRAELERAGTPIGSLDTLIAAHALSLEAVLVTNNEREFGRVPDLRVENWAV